MELASATFIGLGIGFLAGLVISIFMASRHDWDRWAEVGRLTVCISDEFDGYKEKKYRCFERECKDCGIIKTKKVRVN